MTRHSRGLTDGGKAIAILTRRLPESNCHPAETPSQIASISQTHWYVAGRFLFSMGFDMDLLHPDHLRNPHIAYGQVREAWPVMQFPQANCWILFDHASVKQALTDTAAFSSRAHQQGSAPFDWMIFQDPPRHTRLRNLVLKAFTPGTIAALEPRIAQISSSLLDAIGTASEFDVAAQFSSL